MPMAASWTTAASRAPPYPHPSGHGALLRDQTPAEDHRQSEGDRHHGDGEPVEQDLPNRHVSESTGHHPHLSQGESCEEGLEQVIIDALGSHPHGEQQGHCQQQHPPLSWGDPAAQQSQQDRDGQGEQQGEQRPHRRDGVETKQLQKQFFIVDDPSKKQGRDQQPPPTAPSVLPRRAYSSHSFPTHVDNLRSRDSLLGRAPCPSPRLPLSPGAGAALAHDFPLYSIPHPLSNPRNVSPLPTPSIFPL